MWTIIGRRLRQNKRGASTVIAIVLSLVILVVIVSNVVLWSYEMTQLDWEKMNEEVTITNVTRVTNSSWFVTQSEYAVNTGSLVNGTYQDTQAVNYVYETFQERLSNSTFDMNGTFSLGLSTYPLDYIQTVEIQLKYRANDTGENWCLKAHNWTATVYSDSGFNNTSGHRPSGDWDTYAVSLTDSWRSYVSGGGIMYVKLLDNQADVNQTTIDIDFLGVRVKINGTRFTFKNEGSATLHLVSLWIINSTLHQHYDMDVFANSAETYPYIRADISLASGSYTVKVVTIRGNKAVYSAEV